MTTPTDSNRQSPSEDSVQTPWPGNGPRVDSNPMSDLETSDPRKEQGCPPIIGACGCQFKPCHIGLVGSMIHPHLHEPHFTTVMRNAIKKRNFNEDSFNRLHRMLGIDPSPDETDKEVRKIAHIPWLLGHSYPSLPKRLEAVIRRALEEDTTFSNNERDHCCRMLGMDDGAIAARNKHRACPTCGTPEGYRPDGGPGSASDAWRGPLNPRTGKYDEQPWQRDIRNRSLARRQADSAGGPSSQRPNVTLGPPPWPSVTFGPHLPVGDRDEAFDESDQGEVWDFSEGRR